MSQDQLPSPEQIPGEFQFSLTATERKLYQDLLVYMDTNGLENPSIIAFTLANGTHQFSIGNPLYILQDILEESVLSDRLLVIVSVAYLEDQLRLMLEKFFTDDDVSRELLDPNKNISIASLVPMANLAYALGLLAKDWHEILKRMAQLRNKFAHIPSARSFQGLVEFDSKSSALLDSLKQRYNTLIMGELNKSDDFKGFYLSLFLTMYQLTQYAIDHVVLPQHREPFDGKQIVGITALMGMNKQTIETLLS